MLGAVSATVTGAAFAGLGFGLLAGQAFFGAFMALAFLVKMLTSSPLTLIAWIVSMALVQVILIRVRRASA